MEVQCSLLFFGLQQPFMYFINVVISPPVYFHHSFLWIQQVIFSRLLTILAASLYIYFLTDFFFKYSVQTQTYIPKVWGEHDDKTVLHGTLSSYRQCHMCLGFLLWYSTYSWSACDLLSFHHAFLQSSCWISHFSFCILNLITSAMQCLSLVPLSCILSISDASYEFCIQFA